MFQAAHSRRFAFAPARRRERVFSVEVDTLVPLKNIRDIDGKAAMSARSKRRIHLSESRNRPSSRVSSATIISLDASMTGQHDRRVRTRREPHGT